MKQNILKIVNLIIVALLSIATVLAQLPSITVEKCQEMAENNYPLIAMYNILDKTKEYNLSNANRAYLPQVSLIGQATIQTDVPKIPIDFKNLPPPLSGVSIPDIDKDQYQIVAEVNQIVWDGGEIKSNKRLIDINSKVEKQKIKSQIYKLKKIVNDVYFAILLLNEQLKLQSSLEKELELNYKKIESYIENGVANNSDLIAIKIEQERAKQKRIFIESERKAYLITLSTLVGATIDENSKIVKPTVEEPLNKKDINRPELTLFNYQSELLNVKRNLLYAQNLPKIALFAQGGYGKPNLNIFENKFSPFFIGGVRFMWKFGNLYTLKNKKETISLQQQGIETKKEMFVWQIKNEIPKQQMEIEKYKKVLENDNRIVSLSNELKRATEAKVENGTLTAKDLTEAINVEEISKQNRLLHEIEYLLSIYQLKYTLNN